MELNPETSLMTMLYGHGDKKRACVCTRADVHVYKGRLSANVRVGTGMVKF